jgi:hypothetical protein
LLQTIYSPIFLHLIFFTSLQTRPPEGRLYCVIVFASFAAANFQRVEYLSSSAAAAAVVK